ncbi:MAG TPA: DNA mismatch repair protein MutS, partial [Armatimonadetes bacterium]|nr:DNA mismatch repair protein MutS [Armatimonadota bacterium]
MANKVTPLLRQYRQIKQQYPDVILLFRLGDFYEMFGEDAKLAARELELTLTKRDFGQRVTLPMCGVPHHAVERYLARLIAKGYKAAICEQMEDPAKAKGLVRREVIRVVTPGTLLEDTMLDAKSNNFLLSLVEEQGDYGLAVVDVSTGEFLVTELRGERAGDKLLDELSRLQPAELLLPPGLMNDAAFCSALAQACEASLTEFEPDPLETRSPAERLCEHFQVTSLHGFGCADLPLAVEAAANALAYLRETQMSALEHLTALGTYSSENFMTLDAATRRNLELTQSLRDGGREGTLLWLLDHTLTPMGARRLKNWVLRPLTEVEQIKARLDAVEELYQDALLREDLRERLRKVYDL